MKKTPFLPSRNGFHFPNNFTNHVINMQPLGSWTTYGRCGGMAWASLDYYNNNLLMPTCNSYGSGRLNRQPPSCNGVLICNSGDFANTGNVPSDTGSQSLGSYIYGRLIDTFRLCGATFLEWFSSSDHSTLLDPISDGVIHRTKTVQWPSLQLYLNNGTPMPIGLIDAGGSLGDAHQVVAYDYDISGDLITIFIYDNNFPDDDTCYIQSTISDNNPHWNESNCNGAVSYNINGTQQIWRGFFVEDSYSPAFPPFTDINIHNGLSINNSSGQPITVIIGGSFSCDCTIKNDGPYPAHLSSLSLSLINLSSNKIYSSLLGQSANLGKLDILSGATVEVGSTIDSFGIDMNSGNETLSPGNYKLAITYETCEGHASPSLPKEPGTTDTLFFDLISLGSVSIVLGTETQYVNSGIGGYKVNLSAIPNGFTASAFKWFLGGNPVSSGNPVSLMVTIGPISGKYQYDHVVTVIADDGTEGGVEATYDIHLPKPKADLIIDDLGSSHTPENITSRGFGNGGPSGPLCRFKSTTWDWEKITIDSQTTGLFAPVNYSWQASWRQVSSSQLPSPSVFQESVDGGSITITVQDGDVSETPDMTATDSIGQAVSATLTIPVHEVSSQGGCSAIYQPTNQQIVNLQGPGPLSNTNGNIHPTGQLVDSGPLGSDTMHPQANINSVIHLGAGGSDTIMRISNVPKVTINRIYSNHSSGLK